MKECLNCGAINNEGSLECHACGADIKLSGLLGAKPSTTMPLGSAPRLSPPPPRRTESSPQRQGWGHASAPEPAPEKGATASTLVGVTPYRPTEDLRSERDQARTPDQRGERPPSGRMLRVADEEKGARTQGFPFKEKRDEKADEAQEGAQTLFGVPGNKAAREERTSAPWMSFDPRKQDNKDPGTLGPWSSRSEAPRATAPGPAPPVQKEKKPPVQNKTALARGGPVQPPSQVIPSKPSQPSAPIQEPRKALLSPSRQKTVTMGGKPSFMRSDEEAPSNLLQEGVMRSTLMGLPSVDAFQKELEEEIANDLATFQIPNEEVRHTAQLPSLRDDMIDEASQGAADEPFGFSKDDNTPGSGLFKFPSRDKKIKVRGDDSRKTLQGIPAITNESARDEATRSSPTLASSGQPGQYVFSGQNLTVRPERIRISTTLKSPDQSNQPPDERTGKSGATMEMSIPVLGSRAEPSPSPAPAKAEKSAPSTTMRMAVPAAFGDTPSQVRSGTSPSRNVSESSNDASARTQNDLVARGAKPGLRGAPASTMRINISEAMTHAEEEELGHAPTRELKGLDFKEPKVPEVAEIKKPEVQRLQIDDGAGDFDNFFGEDDEGPSDTVQISSVAHLLDPLASAKAPDPVEPSPSKPPERDPEPVAVAPLAETAPSIAPPQAVETAPEAPVVEEAPALVAPASQEAAPALAAPALWDGERLARYSATLAGLALTFVPVLYFVASGSEGFTAGSPLSVAAMGFPLIAGLIVGLAGLIKLPPALRSLIISLVGVLVVALFVVSDIAALQTFGDPIGRTLAAIALLLPVGLIWRSAYPSSGLSRAVVIVGMVMVVLNYLRPDGSGASPVGGLLAALASPELGSVLVGAAGLVPLALVLPSMAAFRGASKRSLGALWASGFALWLLALPLVAALASGGAGLVGALALGVGLSSGAWCVSVGLGGLLGWLTRPSDKALSAG